MTENNLTGKDILLLLLYLPGKTGKNNEPISGRTRLTKMIYIFEKEIKDSFDNLDKGSMPEFFAYNYGPFSRELFDDLQFFINIGFIEEVEVDIELNNIKLNEEDYYEYKYNISEEIGFGEIDEETIENEASLYSYKLKEKGSKYVENNILNNITNEQRDLLIKFKEKVNSLSLDSLISYVYNKYPEDTKKSKIRNDYISEEGVDYD